MFSLAHIKIILVEPAGALNVGSVARVMKNMGLQQLVLVNPQCDRHSDDAQKMAVHAKDILAQAQEVPTLGDALIGCQRAIATTGRPRSPDLPLTTPREALPWLLAENLNTALIFGREDRGLSNEELSFAQRYLYIPANSAYPSLNLAQAVAVCAYELRQAAIDPAPPVEYSATAPLDHLEAYYHHLEQTLLDIGYLYPHTAAARMKKIRRIYHRANLTPEDLALLRGMLSQIDWYRQQIATSASQSPHISESVKIQD
jgi:tRNA/rRNA methyltransferase